MFHMYTLLCCAVHEAWHYNGTGPSYLPCCRRLAKFLEIYRTLYSAHSSSLTKHSLCSASSVNTVYMSISRITRNIYTNKWQYFALLFSDINAVCAQAHQYLLVFWHGRLYESQRSTTSTICSFLLVIYRRPLIYHVIRNVSRARTRSVT